MAGPFSSHMILSQKHYLQPGSISSNLINEVEAAIASIDAYIALTKESQESTKQGKLLLSPIYVNQAIKTFLEPLGWKTEVRYKGYAVDLVKDRVALEVQFGKYAFVPSDIMMKLPIYAHANIIDASLVILPSKNLTKMMSSGVANYDSILKQFALRGTLHDIPPTMIMALDMTEDERLVCRRKTSVDIVKPALPTNITEMFEEEMTA